MIRSFLFLALLTTALSAAAFPFKATERTVLDEWIAGAQSSQEVDASQLKKLDGDYKDVIEQPKNANAVFDYGRILTAIMQPGLGKTEQKPLSPSGKKIIAEAEKAYRDAIQRCECHGRANIMLGLLYNQQGKYYISEPHLEKGLKLKEGGEDWMIAANQYLLAGAYTHNTETKKYLKVYDQFKQYAPTVAKNGAYYRKMAGLYVSYYEK